MEQQHTSAPALLGPAEIRTLAGELDVTPTKKWGQNFVHDPNTVRMIVAQAELDPADNVVEIGPGLGSLTLALLEKAAHVTAVEIDPRLAARLPRTAAERAPQQAGNLTVIEHDAMTITQQDFRAAGAPLPTALVANLPYNVSVPVLMHMLEEFPTIRRVLVMVQLEVADRLSATAGTKIYGVPSVKAAFYGRVSFAGKIGKKVFWPEPKIESGLVRIDRYTHHTDTPPWSEELRPKVFPLVDAAFAQRRKTLRAALKGQYGSGDKAAAALSAAGIDPTERGEKLSVEDFVRLATTAPAGDVEL